jgi:hypothetical protein
MRPSYHYEPVRRYVLIVLTQARVWWGGGEQGKGLGGRSPGQVASYVPHGFIVGQRAVGLVILIVIGVVGEGWRRWEVIFVLGEEPWGLGAQQSVFVVGVEAMHDEFLEGQAYLGEDAGVIGLRIGAGGRRGLLFAFWLFSFHSTNPWNGRP